MKKESFEIELLKKRNVSDAVNLVRTSFNPSYLFASIYRCHGIVYFIESELENDFSPYRYFGAYEDENLIGFAEFKLYPNRQLVFLNVIAIENTRKQIGVATTLFDKALSIFKKEGYKRIELDVFQSNSSALRWYEKLGFIISRSSQSFKIQPVDLLTQVSLQIINLPQFLITNKYLGFYFLDVLYKDENIKIGIIDNDMIIRNVKYSDVEIIVSQIQAKFNINDIYFIGDDIPDRTLHNKDEIIRMTQDIV